MAAGNWPLFSFRYDLQSNKRPRRDRSKSMASLQYGAYPGLGQYVLEHMGFNQAVRVGDRIEISGQGGWDITAPRPTFAEDIKEEVAQAFQNVDLALKSVGGKGWSQVYRIRSYHTDLTPEVTTAMAENIKKYMPAHKPIWTQVGSQLAVAGMRVEIEVAAYDPEGTK